MWQFFSTEEVFVFLAYGWCKVFGVQTYDFQDSGTPKLLMFLFFKEIFYGFEADSMSWGNFFYLAVSRGILLSVVSV